MQNNLPCPRTNIRNCLEQFTIRKEKGLSLLGTALFLKVTVAKKQEIFSGKCIGIYLVNVGERYE